MADPIDWRAGVPIKLLRAGYQRKPQDVIQRLQMETGPPLRRLLAGSAGQSVKGTLSMSEAQADDFEDWRRNELDRGARQFNWIITDNARPVVARLGAQPKLTRLRNRWRYAMEIECVAPLPSPAALTALAALEDAGPVAWPAGVPFRPQRGAFGKTPDDRILRSPADGPQHQQVTTRAEGWVEDVVLHLTTAELATFEAWFESAAGFGAMDILFPDLAGGVHLGSFRSVYTITPPSVDKWAVQFPVYLEAIA